MKTRQDFFQHDSRKGICNRMRERLEKNELLLLEKAHKLLSDKYAQYQKSVEENIYYNDNCAKNDNLE